MVRCPHCEGTRFAIELQSLDTGAFGRTVVVEAYVFACASCHKAIGAAPVVAIGFESLFAMIGRLEQKLDDVENLVRRIMRDGVKAKH